jgi:uncharacterized protein YycO
LDFEESRKRYLETNDPKRSSVPLEVGHIALIHRQGPIPYVIEAIPLSGVKRSSYLDWIAARPGYVIWHGRLRNFTANYRANVAIEASKQIGKPYDLWNFNLNDDTSFYSAKLVWLSTFRSLGIAIDDNPNPIRWFWLSPGQILSSRRVTLLFDPGDEGRL